MGITLDRIQGKLRSNPEMSNAQMARLFIEEDKLNPYDVEKIRQRIRKLKKNMPDEIVEVAKVNQSTGNILVIGDLHCPAVNPNYLSFNINLATKYNCSTIIFIGDIIDGHSISYHESNANMQSPKDELELAKIELSKWYSAFPNATVLLGNHDSLYNRKLNTAGLPEIVLKPLSQILGVDKWNFKDEHTIGNNYFTHGTKLNVNSIKNKALKVQKNVVCGHLHSESYIKNVTQDIWVSHIGCGVDFNSRFFDYARGTDKEPILSSLVILDNQPILITM